ncbi:MAG: hypothetical protein EBR07_07035 [Planctomycetes bacterium]|nr:hypothetical protein [Planctomycetota bacterium]
MKHLLAGVVAVVMFALALFVIWTNRTHIGLAEMCFAGGFVMVGGGILAPLDLKEALGPLGIVAKIARGKPDA